MEKELQYMPIGEVKRRNNVDTRGYRTTEIKNHGKKLGVARWNSKLLLYLLTGSLAVGGAAFVINGRSDTSAVNEPQIKSETMIGEIPSQVAPVVVENRVIVDYKVTSGDTLNGIIYKYAKDANEMESIKNDVCFYNGLESNSMLQMGQIITLVRVPESKADELNTGYNSEIDMNDELSQTLNLAIEELNGQMGRVASGSLLDTVNKELKVYNSTTNKSVRKKLASMMNQQIYQVQQYEMAESQSTSRGSR